MNLSSITNVTNQTVARPLTAPGSNKSTGGVGGIATNTKPGASEGFGSILTDFVKQANDQQAVADQKIEQFAVGKEQNVQEVVVSMAKADLSFRMVMEIRDKVLDSYQEVMRMQV